MEPETSTVIRRARVFPPMWVLLAVGMAAAAVHDIAEGSWGRGLGLAGVALAAGGVGFLTLAQRLTLTDGVLEHRRLTRIDRVDLRTMTAVAEVISRHQWELWVHAPDGTFVTVNYYSYRRRGLHRALAPYVAQRPAVVADAKLRAAILRHVAP